MSERYFKKYLTNEQRIAVLQVAVAFPLYRSRSEFRSKAGWFFELARTCDDLANFVVTGEFSPEALAEPEDSD